MKELSTGYGQISVKEDCGAVITEKNIPDENWCLRTVTCPDPCEIKRNFLSKKGLESQQDEIISTYLQEAEATHGSMPGRSNQ